MATHSLRIGCRASLMSLAVLAVMIGNAQAAIDVGQTIDAVTTITTSSSTPYDGLSEPIYSNATTATISMHSGVVDAQTSLQWIKASDLAEGQSLGYRAATSDEFRSFVEHMGWTPVVGSTDEYALTSGFSYVESSSRGNGSMGSTSTFDRTNNLSPVSFTADARLSGEWWPMIASYRSQRVSLAWLDGVEGGTVGAMFSATNSTRNCSSGRSYSCQSVTDDAHEALVGTSSDLLSGRYDSATHATGSNWSSLVSTLTQADGSVSLMYYMVATVPEPSSYALMGLGLVGVLAATRRQGRAC